MGCGNAYSLEDALAGRMGTNEYLRNLLCASLRGIFIYMISVIIHSNAVIYAVF